MEIEKILSESWKIYKKNWVTFVIAEILISAIDLVAIGILVSSLLVPDWQQMGVMPLAILILVLSIGLESGIYYLAKEGRKKKVYMENFWKGVRKYWLKFVGVRILVGIIFLFASIPLIFFILSKIWIGVILYYVFLFLLAPLFSLAPVAIVFNKSVISSIKESIRIGYRNYLFILVILLIYSLLQGVLSLIGYAGVLINWLVIDPMESISFVLIYKYFKSRKYFS